jgi:hypothetical protein
VNQQVPVVLDLLRSLLSDNPDERERGADEITDVYRGTDDLAVVLADVLAAVAVVETSPSARESELHALAELEAWGLASSTAREIAARIPLDDLSISEREYLTQISGRKTEGDAAGPLDQHQRDSLP